MYVHVLNGAKVCLCTLIHTMVSPLPIITNRVSLKREALHGEGLIFCLLFVGRGDCIGLFWWDLIGLGVILAVWAGHLGGGLVGNVGR